MNTANENRKASGSSAASLLAAGVVQTVIVLLVAVGLMFTLRGKPAEQQIQDRWAAGGEVSGELFDDKEPVPPVKSQWPSEEALLAAAPAAELVEKSFTYEDLEFSIQVPAAAEIETPGGPEILVKLTPQIHMEFREGHSDLEARKSQVSVFFSPKPFPFQDDDILLVELDQELEQRFDFYANVTLGYFDFWVTADSDDGEYETSNTRAECLLMLKCLRTLKLKSEIPTGAAEFVEAAGGDVERGEGGEVVEVDLFSTTTGPTLLARIGEFPQLRSLRFESHNVSSADFAVLEKFPQLRKLTVTGGRSLNDKELSYIVKCTNLESFSGSMSNATAQGLATIGGLSKLNTLRLDLIETEAMPGVSELGKLSELEILELRSIGEPWPASALAFVPKLVKLKQLSLTGSFDDAAAANLAGLPELEQLEIDGAVITDAGFKPLTTFPKLTWLQIEGPNPIYNLGEMKLTSAGLAPLEKLASLKTLIVHHSLLDDAAVDTIVAMPKLTRVDLIDSQLTDAALPKLAEWEQLSRLSVRESKKISKEAAEAFKQARPNVYFSH